MLDASPLSYEMEGRRLLKTSRPALYRLTTLALAYRTTGDARLTQRAIEELQAILAFPDWNPGHWLDTAEMAVGVTLAYDWLFDELPVELRSQIREALLHRILRPVTTDQSTGDLWWMKSSINWNPVCFAAVTLAALVVAEHEPQLAGEAIDLVRRHNPKAMHVYQPDGVYAEGSSYWNYGTTFQVLLIDALQTAIGDSFDIEEAPGFLQSASFLEHITGPSGRLFNFSDASAKSQPQPALFWFASITNDLSLIDHQIDYAWQDTTVEMNRLMPLGAIWWARLKECEPAAPAPIQAWRGRGEQPLAVFRGPTQAGAWFLATKGGSASLNHGHMDAGCFVLEAMGRRWADDLGMQDYYRLESHGIKIFDNSQNGDRWRVFAHNQLSHNTLTLDGQPHRVRGHAPLTEFAETASTGSASYDLTAVLGDAVDQAKRSFELDFIHGQARISDSLSGLKQGSRVRWAMLTTADIQLDGTRCILELDGEQLRVQSLPSPKSAFSWIDAQRLTSDIDLPLPGYKLLLIEVDAPASGRVEIQVEFMAMNQTSVFTNNVAQHAL